MVWKFSNINSTQWRNCFLISSGMSGSWIWLKNERSFNTRGRSQWKWIIRDRWKKILRSRWKRMCLMNQQRRVRFWSCMRAWRRVKRSWSQSTGKSYPLGRWWWSNTWWIFSFTIQKIMNRRCIKWTCEKNEDNNENISSLRSEAVFRLGFFEETDGSSVLLCRAEVVGLSHCIASKDFRCLKGFDFLATVFVRDGSGNGNGRGSISHGCAIWTRQRVLIWVIAGLIDGPTGIDDRGGSEQLQKCLLNSQRKL